MHLENPLMMTRHLRLLINQVPPANCFQGNILKEGQSTLHWSWYKFRLVVIHTQPLCFKPFLNVVCGRKVALLEKPQVVDSELVLRITGMDENAARGEFSFWSQTHTLRVDGLGHGGYNFQLAVALKPTKVDQEIFCEAALKTRALLIRFKNYIKDVYIIPQY